MFVWNPRSDSRGIYKGPGVVKFFRRGVLLEEHTADLGVPGARAYVACSRLQTDLSGLGVIRDQEYEELLTDIRARTLELASETLIVGDKHQMVVKPLAKALQNALL